MTLKDLVRVGKTAHTAHHPEDVVIGSVDADLGSLGALDCCVGKNKLQSGVVNPGEVAAAGWLVLFWAKCEGVYIDSCVRVAGVVLEWLDQVEVSAFPFREAVLTVELKLACDNWVLTPAMEVKCGFSEHECTCI